MKKGIAKTDLRTDMRGWLRMDESLSRAPDWSPDDLPLEIVQAHISVILLSRRYALKCCLVLSFGPLRAIGRKNLDHVGFKLIRPLRGMLHLW